MNNGAFKNPQSDSITDAQGVLGNITIPALDDDYEGEETQETLQQKITDITDALDAFNSHTAKLSGTGDVGEFSKIMGIASSFNKSKASLEKSKQDNFSGMFGSIIDGGAKIDAVQIAGQAVKDAISSGLDTATIESLVNEAEQAKSSMEALKSADESAFNKGFAYVVKQGIGQGLASVAGPDGDCFAKELLQKHIGTDALKGAMSVENFSDPLKENLPDVSTINMDFIDRNVGDYEDEAEQERSATSSNITNLQTEIDNLKPEITNLKSRTTSVESSLGLKSADTHDHDKIDGGSYGI